MSQWCCLDIFNREIWQKSKSRRSTELSEGPGRISASRLGGPIVQIFISLGREGGSDARTHELSKQPRGVEESRSADLNVQRRNEFGTG